MTKSLRTAAVAALAVAVMLAGCAVEPSSSAGGVPSATPTLSAAPTGDTGDTAGSDATTDATGCLYGTWTADNAFFLSAIREFGDEVKKVTGEVVLTFAPDGALTTEYRAWEITAVSEGAEVTITRDGADLARFEATDSTVTLEDTAVGSNLVLNAAGAEMAITPVPAAYTDAPYTCDTAAATITTPDGTLQLLR